MRVFRFPQKFAIRSALNVNDDDRLKSSLMRTEQELNTRDIDRVIQMAWEDRTPFDAIKLQFLLDESAVIQLMRAKLSVSGFRMWRKRVTGRKTKHLAMRSVGVTRFRCPDQKS